MITIIRNKTGLSQSQLALYLGISKAMVNMVERGQRELKAEASNKFITCQYERGSIQGENKIWSIRRQNARIKLPDFRRTKKDPKNKMTTAAARNQVSRKK